MPQTPHTPSQAAATPTLHEHEEPEITQEEAVPSDGRDEHGEQMMRELGEHKPGPALDDTPTPKQAQASKP